MCGRYSITASADRIARLFKVKGALPNLQARYNLAPSQAAPVIRLQDGGRGLAMLRWGLVPHWAKEPSTRYSTINARAETVDKKPAFRDAYRKRRCLVVADGFYEWQARKDGPKQPYRITMNDGKPFGMAGLWERWEWEDESLETFTIIVCNPNELVRPIHDRMPVILPFDHHEAWLEGRAGKELLIPFPAGEMTAYPISTRINNPKNDDPTVIEHAN